jgi:hypothetical protein
MAGKQEIELFISDNGELKVHIKGIKGPGCLKAVEAITKEVGIETERHLTGEYYESEKGKDTSGTKIKNQ